jgi:hypothetical protein
MVLEQPLPNNPGYQPLQRGSLLEAHQFQGSMQLGREISYVQAAHGLIP